MWVATCLQYLVSDIIALLMGVVVFAITCFDDPPSPMTHMPVLSSH